VFFFFVYKIVHCIDINIQISNRQVNRKRSLNQMIYGILKNLTHWPAAKAFLCLINSLYYHYLGLEDINCSKFIQNIVERILFSSLKVLSNLTDPLWHLKFLSHSYIPSSYGPFWSRNSFYDPLKSLKTLTFCLYFCSKVVDVCSLVNRLLNYLIYVFMCICIYLLSPYDAYIHLKVKLHKWIIFPNKLHNLLYNNKKVIQYKSSTRLMTIWRM